MADVLLEFSGKIDKLESAVAKLQTMNERLVEQNRKLAADSKAASHASVDHSERAVRGQEKVLDVGRQIARNFADQVHGYARSAVGLASIATAINTVTTAYKDWEATHKRVAAEQSEKNKNVVSTLAGIVPAGQLAAVQEQLASKDYSSKEGIAAFRGVHAAFPQADASQKAVLARAAANYAGLLGGDEARITAHGSLTGSVAEMGPNLNTMQAAGLAYAAGSKMAGFGGEAAEALGSRQVQHALQQMTGQGGMSAQRALAWAIEMGRGEESPKAIQALADAMTLKKDVHVTARGEEGAMQRKERAFYASDIEGRMAMLAADPELADKILGRRAVGAARIDRSRVAATEAELETVTKRAERGQYLGDEERAIKSSDAGRAYFRERDIDRMQRKVDADKKDLAQAYANVDRKSQIESERLGPVSGFIYRWGDWAHSRLQMGMLGSDDPKDNPILGELQRIRVSQDRVAHSNEEMARQGRNQTAAGAQAQAKVGAE